MRFLKIAAAMAALSMCAMATEASATVYNLNQSATFGNGTTYGVVTTTQNGSDVDVSVTLAAGFKFVTSGGPHDLFTFNTNDPSYGVTNINIATLTRVQPGTNPNYGTFTDALICPTCGNGAGDSIFPPLTFKVTNTTLANFVPNGPNNTGYVFSADVINTATGSTGAIAAFQSVEINPLGVPEASTWGMMILGFGMVGAGLRLGRRSKAQVA